jgi:hypothetical protein
MAALNFPTSPTLNQIFTANGKSWKWDGTAWKSFNTISISGGGTGLTSITAGNAFLSSNSAGSGLTYRTFVAGAGTTVTIDSNSVTFGISGSGIVGGSGTSAFVPIWTASGSDLQNSIMQQFESTMIISGQLKATTKSFKIDHPLDPKNKYLEHGSLEGPEHGIYQRGKGSGYGLVTINLPSYFTALSEDSYSIIVTPRNNTQLFVTNSNPKSFSVSRIGPFKFIKKYIEFDYLIIGERNDIKIEVEQTKT